MTTDRRGAAFWASRANYEQLRPHVSGTFKADFGGISLKPRENARSMPRSIQNWKIRALAPCCGSLAISRAESAFRAA
jgi:hypothetical protein